MFYELALVCLVATVRCATVEPSPPPVAAEVAEKTVVPADAVVPDTVGEAAASPEDASWLRSETSAAGRSSDIFLPQRFDGHVVLKVVPDTEDKQEVLSVLLRGGQFDVWRHPAAVGAAAMVRVTPAQLNWTSAFLDEHSIAHETAIADVQRLIDSQTETRQVVTTVDWRSFPRLDVMYTWMEDLVRRFPAVATLVKGGFSNEGRNILGVRIAHAADLPVIYVEAGIHGREWASSSSATYILDQLLTSADPAVALAARSFEWHIFPSVNPDAHEYTHTTDRLWRKSRKPTTTLCRGADLNRNFPVSWGTVGVSWDFCSDVFPGTRAASEVETRTRMAYMQGLLPRMKASVALHSFGQFLLLPWGFTTAEPRDYQELVAVASKAAEAFARPHGTPLTIGTIAKVLYPASGASMDWLHSRGVPYTYTLELRDRGHYGFLLPAAEIIPASEEALAGVVGMADAVLQRLSKPQAA